MGELHPIDDDLDLHNMRIMAERTQWPSGTLRVCERLRREMPGWTVWWGTGRGDRPPAPGYYAIRDRQEWGEPPAYGQTPEALRQAARSWPYGRRPGDRTRLTPLQRSKR